MLPTYIKSAQTGIKKHVKRFVKSDLKELILNYDIDGHEVKVILQKVEPEAVLLDEIPPAKKPRGKGRGRGRGRGRKARKQEIDFGESLE